MIGTHLDILRYTKSRDFLQTFPRMIISKTRSQKFLPLGTTSILGQRVPTQKGTEGIRASFRYPAPCSPVIIVTTQGNEKDIREERGG